MGRKSTRRYTQEFKHQAAELAARIGSSRAADQLGVPVSSIHGWKKDRRKSETTESKKTKSGLEAENRRLEREVDELRKINDILKRAAAFFSQGHLK